MLLKSRNSILAAVSLFGALALPLSAANADGAAYVLTISQHRFTPAVLTVPAGQRIRLEIVNRDPATEEFDSHDLRVEKLITPGGRATVFIGPLAPGTYAFMGEFHPATAQGRIVAVAAAGR